MPGHPSSPHPYNPNEEFASDPEAEMYWLQLSDFYEWPHIQQFDDLESDLPRKLAEANLTRIHLDMVEENKIREKNLVETWCDIIENIP